VTVHNTFLTLHIISVVTWVGGGIMMQALATRARAAGSTRLVDFAQDAAWTGNHVFMPASIATLVFGILTATVGAGHVGLKLLWIKLAFVGWLLTAVNGGAVLGRISRKLRNETNEHGPDAPVVRDTAKRLLMAMNIDLVIVVAVIVDMVFKPA